MGQFEITVADAMTECQHDVSTVLDYLKAATGALAVRASIYLDVTPDQFSAMLAAGNVKCPYTYNDERDHRITRTGFFFVGENIPAPTIAVRCVLAEIDHDLTAENAPGESAYTDDERHYFYRLGVDTFERVVELAD